MLNTSGESHGDGSSDCSPRSAAFLVMMFQVRIIPMDIGVGLESQGRATMRRLTHLAAREDAYMEYSLRKADVRSMGLDE
jgi:hypothetical protein